MENLIGKQVTAIGDSGMTKNVAVKGVLKSTDILMQSGVLIDSKGRKVYVKYKTIQGV